jgi:hypothetical protein
MNILSKILVLASMLAISTITMAAGLAVTPSSIDLTGPVGQVLETTVTVSNLSADVAVFEVYPDSLDRQIIINPTSFILEAGEAKDITVTVLADEPVVFTDTISVVSKPLSDSQLGFGTGIKVPISITTTDVKGVALAAAVGEFGWLRAGLLGILVILLAILAVSSIRKRNHA